MTAPKAVAGDGPPSVPSHELLLQRAMPGEPMRWPSLIGSEWEPRAIPNVLEPVGLSVGDVWDALVDVVLDVCCWLFRKVVR